MAPLADLIRNRGHQLPRGDGGRFASGDEEAQYLLGLLREGTPDEKIEARDRLSLIFESRGMLEEAIELLEANGRAGIRTRQLFTHLSSLYRRVGRDDAADASLAEAATLATLENSTRTARARQAAHTSGPTSTEPHSPSGVRPGLDRPPSISQTERQVASRLYESATSAITQPTGREPERSGGRGMRVAALVLGIIGGVLGLLAALFALSIGGIGAALQSEGASSVVSLGWSALLFCFLGFLGSGFALSKPRFSSLVLLVSGIGFLISISWFAVITTPLFLMASLFAFLGRK